MTAPIAAKQILIDWVNKNKPAEDFTSIKVDTQVIFLVIALGALAICESLLAVANAIKAHQPVVERDDGR